MKKFALIVVIISVVAVALGSTGIAFAQTSGNGTGWMSMGGRGSQGGMMGAGHPAAGTGVLHDYMIAAYAEKLNIPVVDLETRLASGETMAQIALSTGLTLDEFRGLMVEVRTIALDRALADGVLTRAQADRLKAHGAGK